MHIPPLGELDGPRGFLRNGLCCLRTPLWLGNRLSFLNDFLFSHLLNIDFPPPAPLIEQKPIRLCLLFSRVWDAGGGGGRCGGGGARRRLRACASVQVAVPSAEPLEPRPGCPGPHLGHQYGAGTPSPLGCRGEWWQWYREDNLFLIVS